MSKSMSPEPVRSRLLIPTATLGIALVAIALTCFWFKRPQASRETSGDSTALSSVSAAPHPLSSTSLVRPLRERTIPGAPTIKQSESKIAASAEGAGSPYARELLTGLTQFNPNDGVSSQKAGELKQSFTQLAQQGPAAVPAIRAYLDRLQDIDFDAIGAGNQIGYSSLRIGLLDVLGKIGGPEAQAVLHQTLKTSADPAEIAFLARNLETLAPGEYRQEALSAAREALAQAANGQLGSRDVGPLFSVMEAYGDSTIVTDLETALPQWSFYATLALAGLPNGEGIPALIRLAQEAEPGGTGKNNFRFQMLAQVAAQYPEAGQALLDQARLGQIPGWGWSKIAIGLTGDQYQLPTVNGNSPDPVTPGLKTYHIVSGNQNFYSLPVVDRGFDEQISQRLNLIDQLMAATSNPAAIQALQNARATIARDGQH